MKRKMPAWLAVVVLALVVVPFALASATNSSTDPGVSVGGTTSGDCARPADPTPVNCNEYTQKQDVFLNGSPSRSDGGTYFFAVLVPGGQADPNDGAVKNLSDGPTGYSVDNREFTVDSDGNINPLAGPDFSYAFDANGNGGMGSLSVYPFDDTTNDGGVYILATCKLSDDISSTYIADPSAAAADCKYDAFKIGGSILEPAAGPTVTKDAAGAYTDTYAWTIDKTVDHSSFNTSGSATANYAVTVTHDGGTISGVTVSGTIDVENPNFDADSNTIPVDISDLTDQLSNGTDCTIDTSAGLTLASFDNLFPYTCDLGTSLPQGELDNNVTAEWNGQLLSNGTFLDAGSANFSFKSVSLTPTAVDNCVDVTDTLEGALGTVCVGDDNPTEFGYPIKFDSDPAGTCTKHDNTASFTANTTGTTDDASQEVTVCVGKDLTVSKTATPTFTRTYNWDIAKSVDKTKVTTSGSSATFNYTVTASQTGFTNSAIQATGTITVTNPNDWEAVTLTGVLDSVNNGGTCSLTGGDSPTSTIPASGSATLNYTCTYSTLPAPGTNTATASWDAAAAFTPHGSAQGTAGVSFGAAPTSTVNQTITPTDTFNGGPAVNLCTLTSTPALYCTLTGTDASPFTSHTYHYSRTISVVPGCVNYTNTAATGTGPTSSKTVTVCQLVSGGLTMGFWQNKNGQGIITSYCGGTSGTSLYTFLTGFNPFKDLTSATCSGIATYVTNVIKAATCTSSTKTCNSMLKAQMLATALDVYFSDAALGGDKIFAFNGGNNVKFGSVKIDLTSICAMIDGSSSSTCSGTTENATSAFGGSTCLSVSALLTYAAGQSNIGGSTWYNQVKATQVLAKDTFDSINNSVALTCP
jgi:hypothetical protein